MVRMLSRVVAAVVLTLVGASLTSTQVADAVQPAFVAVGHNPTQGTPVPGAYLTADLGIWSSPPESYEFQWLEDGTPIPGATSQDYLVEVADIGHVLTPQVTGHSGSESAHFVGTSMTVRKLGASLSLDVRRVHPAPAKARLVWTAVSFMTTERPWATDGGTVAAYRKKDRHWKQVGTGVITRGAAVVRLPWKRAPQRVKLRVCYLGSEAVALSCSAPDLVRRPR